LLGEEIEEIQIGFEKIQINGQTPSLDEHVAVALKDRYLVLIGGTIYVPNGDNIGNTAEEKLIKNKDIFVIDILSREICIATPTGALKIKPCASSAAATDGHSIFMFGGIEPHNYSKTLSIINVSLIVSSSHHKKLSVSEGDSLVKIAESSTVSNSASCQVCHRNIRNVQIQGQIHRSDTTDLPNF